MERELRDCAKAGVKLRDAAKQTGLSLWQLRGLVRARKVRSRLLGQYVVLHPDDVSALCRSEWVGEAYENDKTNARRQ